ncbi:MAG: major capsid protein [Clostridia bacterium]|nr:major capsid protein [Clostridia bacterium]
MAFDIYSTYYMDAAIKEKGQIYTFIRDRYFGGTPLLFQTEEVIVDYDDGEGNLIAPFVIPRIGKVPVLRSGYETKRLTPAYIAPSREIDADVLRTRRAGESILSTMTPEQRERQYLLDDLSMLDDMITRREEWMCMQTMLDNACTMTHIGNNGEKGIDLTAKYYDGTNTGVFKPTAAWMTGTETKRGNWYDDICKQIESLSEAGRSVTDVIVGADVAEIMLTDPWVIKMMDNRRIELGTIDPRWQPNGITNLARLNFGGVELDVFTYRGTYQNHTINKKAEKQTLTTTPYMPKSAVVLAAANTGIMRYGAVTQVEMDKQFHTRTGTRITKHMVSEQSNNEETIVTSRPIAAPKIKSPWRACRDVLTT